MEATPERVETAGLAITGGWPIKAPPGPTVVRAGSQPTFSIVIAAYQAAQTLAEALESALTQTYPAAEVIVCDDGSTDGTAAVLQRFNSSVTSVYQENQGEAAAKNAAVGLAGSEYVVVLDADDVFLPRRLEALAWLAMRRPDLDILTTDAIVEADGIPVRRAYHTGWRFPIENQRTAILDRNFIFGLCAVRRDRWLASGGFDPRLAYTADWEFWQRLILGGSRVGLVNEPLARYRLAGGTLSSNRVRLIEARLSVLTRAAAREDLVPAERAVVRAAIRRERRELQLRQADACLELGGWPARKQFGRILLGRDHALRVRLGALLAVVSPVVMARRRQTRSKGTVEIGAGLRINRNP